LDFDVPTILRRGITIDELGFLNGNFFRNLNNHVMLVLNDICCFFNGGGDSIGDHNVEFDSNINNLVGYD
jgi:hypothetical protein